MSTLVVIFLCCLAVATSETTTSEPMTQASGGQSGVIVIRCAAGLEVIQKETGQSDRFDDEGQMQAAVQAQVAAQVARVTDQLETRIRQDLEEKFRQQLEIELSQRLAELKSNLETVANESAACAAALKDTLKVKQDSTDRRLVELTNRVDGQQTWMTAMTNSPDRRLVELRNKVDEQHNGMTAMNYSTGRKIQEMQSTLENQQHDLNDIICSSVQNHNTLTGSTGRQIKEMQRTLENRLSAIIRSSAQNHNTLTSLINSRATHQSCSAISRLDSSADSGVYTLYPPNTMSVIRTWCNMSSSGQAWTVVQRRKDGSVDFARDWAEYERGFGDPQGEFWIGLKALHTLTAAQPSSLRIDLWDFAGGHRFAEYSSFSVGGASTNYKLLVSGYSGTAGDSLTDQHNSRPFSTKDRDNDRWSGENCATLNGGGGWWYWDCLDANLNGRYYPGVVSKIDGVNWYSYKAVSMMVRPR